MFRSFVSDLNRTSLGRLRTLIYYQERHIDLDGDSHGPMALRMVADLCGEDDKRWNEAAHAAIGALEARTALGSGIHDRILARRRMEVMSTRGVTTAFAPRRSAEVLG